MRVDVQVPPSHAEGRRTGGVAPGESQGFPGRFAVPLIPTLRPFRVRRPGSPPRMRNHNMSALDTHGNTVFFRTFRTPPKRAPRKEPGKWFMNPHRHCRFLVCWDAKGAKCSGFPMGFRMVNGIRSPCAVSGRTPRILRIRISPFLAHWPAQGGASEAFANAFEAFYQKGRWILPSARRILSLIELCKNPRCGASPETRFPPVPPASAPNPLPGRPAIFLRLVSRF